MSGARAAEATATGTRPTAVTDAERAIGEQMYLALGRLLRWSARQSPDQLGPGVLSALGTVVDNGRLRLGDLAAREGVSPASLSRIVAVLEAESLVSRSVDPADRRSAFLTATRAGATLVRERRRDRGERLARHLGPLSTARLDAMREIVRAVDELIATT